MTEEELTLKQLEEIAKTLADFDSIFLNNINLSFLDQDQVHDSSSEQALNKLQESNGIDLEPGYIDVGESNQICSEIKELSSDVIDSDLKMSYIELKNVKLVDLLDKKMKQESRPLSDETKSSDLIECHEDKGEVEKGSLNKEEFHDNTMLHDSKESE